MYQVVYLKESHLTGEVMSYRVFGQYETLGEARDNRLVSGDLIIKDGSIVEDTSWLWDWEQNRESCYAYRCIKKRLMLDPSLQEH